MKSDLHRLIVHPKLLEAVWSCLVRSRGAHHAGDQVDQGVLVRGVVHGAGLDNIPVAFSLSVLAFELVGAVHLRGLHVQVVPQFGLVYYCTHWYATSFITQF